MSALRQRKNWERTKEYRNAVLGRLCERCQVNDSESPFRNEKTCDACWQFLYRRRSGKVSFCTKCGDSAPAGGNGGQCVICFPDRVVKIILVSPDGERERTVYRRLDSSTGRTWFDLLPKRLEFVKIATPEQWRAFR